MRPTPLFHGTDQLLLKQCIESSSWPNHLWRHDYLRRLFFRHALFFTIKPISPNRMTLNFTHCDFDIRREWGKVTWRAYLKAEPLVLTPRETWEQAQLVFWLLAGECNVAPDPEVLSLDLFIDIQDLNLSASFVGRLHSRHGLSPRPGMDLGWDAVIFGKPKRYLLYNKWNEVVVHPSKAYVRRLWVENGWDEITPVVRLDMRFNAKDLRRCGERIDLDDLAQDALNRLELRRKVPVPRLGRSVSRTDPLWTKLRGLKFAAPWDAAPLPAAKRTLDLHSQARQAVAMVRGQMAKLIAVAMVDPEVVGYWAKQPLFSLAEESDLLDRDFLDRVARHASKLGASIQMGTVSSGRNEVLQALDGLRGNPVGECPQPTSCGEVQS